MFHLTPATFPTAALIALLWCIPSVLKPHTRLSSRAGIVHWSNTLYYVQQHAYPIVICMREKTSCDLAHPVKIFPFFARSNCVWLSIRHRYRSCWGLSGLSQRPRSNMVIVVKLPTLIRPYTIRLWGDSLYSTGEYGITLELWSLLEGAFFYSRYRFWCFCPWIPFGECVHVVANDLST